MLAEQSNYPDISDDAPGDASFARKKSDKVWLPHKRRDGRMAQKSQRADKRWEYRDLPESEESTEAVDTGDVVSPEAHALLAKMYGQPVEGQKLRSIAMTLPDARLSVQAANLHGVEFISMVSKGPYSNSTIELKLTPEGEKVAHLHAVHIDEDKRGVGFQLFQGCIESLRSLGVTRGFGMVMGNVRDREYNGYYTFPRMGFDGPLSPFQKEALPPPYNKADRVSEVMATKEGRAAWKQHGSAIVAEFDLRDGSPHMKTLANYALEREQQTPYKPATYQDAFSADTRWVDALNDLPPKKIPSQIAPLLAQFWQEGKFTPESEVQEKAFLKFAATLPGWDSSPLKKTGGSKPPPEPPTPPSPPSSPPPAPPPAPAPAPAPAAPPVEPPTPPQSHWLNDLGERREAALEAMRSIRAKSDRFYAEGQKLAPRYNEIATGGEHHDRFVKGEALATFLRHLARGDSPEQAAQKAKDDAREMVKNWNKNPQAAALSGNRYSLMRWEQMADETVDDAHRQLHQATKPPPAPPPAGKAKSDNFAPYGKEMDESFQRVGNHLRKIAEQLQDDNLYSLAANVHAMRSEIRTGYPSSQGGASTEDRNNVIKALAEAKNHLAERDYTALSDGVRRWLSVQAVDPEVAIQSNRATRANETAGGDAAEVRLHDYLRMAREKDEPIKGNSDVVASLLKARRDGYTLEHRAAVEEAVQAGRTPAGLEDYPQLRRRP